MDWFVLVGIVGFCLSVAIIVRFFQGASRLREIADESDRQVRPHPDVPDLAAGLQAMPGPGTTRPGWYPDPQDDSLERRWTGTAWAPDEPRPAKRQQKTE